MENKDQKNGMTAQTVELLHILTGEQYPGVGAATRKDSASKRIIVAGFRDYLSGGLIDFFRGYASVAWHFRDQAEVVWSIHPEAALAKVLKHNNSKEYPSNFDIDVDWDFFEKYDKIAFWRNLPELLEYLIDKKSILQIHAPIIGNLQDAYGTSWFYQLTDRFLELKDEYRSQYRTFFDTVTKGTPYKLLHCRVGDVWMFKSAPDRKRFMYDPLGEKIRQVLKKIADPDTVLISDCIELKQWAAETKLPLRGISPSLPVHATTHDGSADTLGIINDISLVRHASEIHTVSLKTSGFSSTIAVFLNIPFQLHLV